jgi:hypothetical protein
MSRIFARLMGLVAALSIAGMAVAQTYDTQFVVMLNDGSNYDVKVQLKANGSTFALGSSNLFFTYNTGSLTNPVLQTAHNFSGGSYSTMSITPSGADVAVNIVLNTVSAGTTVTTGYIDVATIRFTTTNAAGNSTLVWTPGVSVVYKDDESTEVPVGTMNNLNTSPLPVQLVSFTAALLQQSSSVLLKWSTASETNNYGFEVQKAADSKSEYQTIANSFIAGHGTTIDAHSYSFTDMNAAQGATSYRLKQTDLDGTVHYSDAIAVTLTGVEEKPLPTVFALDQNYPNPFNPSTVIEFQLPKESKVTLEVYNLIGQRVATLVNEVRAAGYYAQKFDGTQLGSGVYFCRFTTPDLSFVRKMLLTK